MTALLPASLHKTGSNNNNMPRCSSEPTLLGRLASAESGDEASTCSSDSSEEARLARNRRRAARRRGTRSSGKMALTADAATTAASDTTSGSGGVGDTPLLTWREIITAVLLVGAFLSCLSVFIMLERQPDQQLQQQQQCDSKTQLQLKLASYLYNNYYNESTAAVTSSSSSDGTTTALGNLLASAAADGTCGCPNSQQMNDFETILYLLLTGALMTVVGVTVLLVEDSDGGSDSRGGGGGVLKASAHLLPRRLLTSNVMKDLSERSPWRPKKPIADLFPDTTVLFADIVGFEAWSSQREPTQCLTLLETIYDAFDRLAKTQGIFKVEAVADCYTAAAGLPEPRKDHSEAMAKFAHACMKRFRETTKALEVTLGPDTSDLALRVGIHSGPVTALRGGRSRFQLFGDTVTTAAAILNSSHASKIQLSHETVQLLPKILQKDWVTVRDSSNNMKGSSHGRANKTYWLTMPMPESQKSNMDEAVDRIPRLVDWNVQLLKGVLQQIVAKRYAAAARAHDTATDMNEQAIDKRLRQGKLVIDEVEEVIQLPKYDAALAKAQEQQATVQLSDAVVDQLRDYIMTIAQSYKNNPFHNFAHASHVTMSVAKLLSRILAPKLNTSRGFDDEDATERRRDDDDDDENSDNSDDSSDIDESAIVDDVKQRIHDHTYGITSDPLTQFACMFSALIHDAEHDGVPNTQLVKEETELAAKYKNQSVAEQNSVDVGWSLLMQPRFQDLRNAIYSNEAEMIHFRKLVVNCVMATDICDKQLKDLRNKRWDRAFAAVANPGKDIDAAAAEEIEANVNRKATIVIEHLLQASDVSHTMQHFHVFRKWNEKLFLEMYLAYRDGRSTSDPSKFWYKGEIGFFDFYVIPLAKKLKECGVFGVSSDEYLNYATKNRSEWETKGRGIVDALVEKAELEYKRHRESKVTGDGKKSK